MANNAAMTNFQRALNALNEMQTEIQTTRTQMTRTETLHLQQTTTLRNIITQKDIQIQEQRQTITDKNQQLQEQQRTIDRLQQQIQQLTARRPFTATQQRRIHDEMDEDGDRSMMTVEESAVE